MSLKPLKFRYIPGMISIVFLPIICIIYLFCTKAFYVESCMDIRLFNKNDTMMKKGFDKFIKIHQFKTIHFSDIATKEKLNYSKKLVQTIIKNQDTINGVHFVFGKNSKYETFVNTLDILAQCKAPTYLIDDKGIRFAIMPKPKKSIN